MRTMVACFAAAWSVAAACLAAGEEPFDYFVNSYTVIGLKDYRDGTRVLPDNRFQLAGNTFVRLRFGRELTPLGRAQTKTLLEGWLPVVLFSASDGSVRYDFAAWATPLPDVKDWKQAFDWPSEGENYLNWIKVNITNHGNQAAEARLAADLLQVPPVKAKGSEPIKTSETPLEQPGATSWSLAPGQTVEKVLRVPFAPLPKDKDAVTAWEREDPRVWLDRTVAYWRDVLAGAAAIEVPCRKATEALKAAHVCQLIANDRGVLHAGEGFYDAFWIRDGAYQVMQLEEAGLGEAARTAIDHFLGCQRPDGRFASQERELDANGQAQWALWQYFLMTRDRDWLKKAYPQMRRAADWTAKTRREAPADSPFAGLLPAAFADGEHLYDGKHHIVGYDLWNLRGMYCTADAAEALGRKEECGLLFLEAAAYRGDIDAAWKRTGLAYFPASWEWHKDKQGTYWGNTETLWPTLLFAFNDPRYPNDPRVAATIEEARLRHYGGFVEGTIRWGDKAIHPYMSAYTTMASLIRGEHERAVEDFYWYLVHSTATHAFPEGVYADKRTAWNNTIPHALGAANYANLLRHMLIHESGDELHLLLAVPDWWLADGHEIRVERAPTHFGVMGLGLRGAREGVRAQISLPQRTAPKRVVLHLPRSRPLLGPVAGVEVRYRPDQRQRWDFPTVVRLYRGPGQNPN